MQWTRITKKPVQFPVTATTPSGAPATITGVDVALLPHREGPDAATAWVTADYDPFDGIASVLVSGPDATTPSGLVLPDRPASDLWARIVDNPNVDAALIVSIFLVD
jgi:hypothetical protein